MLHAIAPQSFSGLDAAEINMSVSLSGDSHQVFKTFSHVSIGVPHLQSM